MTNVKSETAEAASRRLRMKSALALAAMLLALVLPAQAMR